MSAGVVVLIRPHVLSGLTKKEDESAAGSNPISVRVPRLDPEILWVFAFFAKRPVLRV